MISYEEISERIDKLGNGQIVKSGMPTLTELEEYRKSGKDKKNAGFGATWACPIASMMMEQYLTGEVKRKDLRKRIGESVLNESVKKW